jgi:hypothetical protein
MENLMLAVVKEQGQEYNCRFLWPHDAKLSFSLQELRFSAWVVPPFPVRPYWATGKGIQAGRIHVVGHGDSFESAEVAAWDKWHKISECKHEFKVLSPIQGDAHCLHCGVAVLNHLMDERLYKAKMLAYEAHDGQKRKYSGEDYIIHPFQVAMHIEVHSMRLGWDAEKTIFLSCAAWLHDVLEDCPKVTEEKMAVAVGWAVVDLVKELTNPSKGVKAPRAVRKQMDRDHLKVVSQEAKIIKLIDRDCNLKDIEDGDKDFIPLYVAESRSLLEVLEGTDQHLEHQLLLKIESYESKYGRKSL